MDLELFIFSAVNFLFQFSRILVPRFAMKAQRLFVCARERDRKRQSEREVQSRGFANLGKIIETVEGLMS